MADTLLLLDIDGVCSPLPPEVPGTYAFRGQALDYGVSPHVVEFLREVSHRPLTKWISSWGASSSSFEEFVGMPHIDYLIRDGIYDKSQAVKLWVEGNSFAGPILIADDDMWPAELRKMVDNKIVHVCPEDHVGLTHQDIAFIEEQISRDIA